MSVKEPSRPLHPVVKVLATILVLCTLVALWVTAARVKANKLAARYGERIEAPIAPAPDDRPSELVLRRGPPTRVGHFSLEFTPATSTLEVRDALDRPLARFPGLQKGDERAWQELRLSVRDATPDELRLGAEFRPGAPCFGGGTYLALKTGLRIDFPRSRSVTLLAWDPVKPEARVKVENEGRVEEFALTPAEPHPAFGLRLTLRSRELDLSE